MWSAPGRGTGGAARVPSHDVPGLDDRLVTPETREEMLRGVKLYAAPSNPEHGDPHCALDLLVHTHGRPGYRPSTDLLTRVADDGDFAADTTLRRAGIDPTTGGRYLEELAFEIVNTQSRAEVTAKAQDMTARGVRRVFAVFVKHDTVCEWRGGQWQTLARDGAIDDPCFVRPLEVAAVLDAALAEDAAVRALAAKGNPELLRRLLERELRGRAEGKSEGKAEGEVRALLTVLTARGFVVDDALRNRVESCQDLAVLTAWIARAATATALAQVFETA